MPTPDGLPLCTECLSPRKSYELDEDGVCEPCERLAGRDEQPLPPPWPTEHVPGTLGKLIVLQWRRESGFRLWHPDDAKGHALPETNSHCRPHTVREPRIYRTAVAV